MTQLLGERRISKLKIRRGMMTDCQQGGCHETNRVKTSIFDCRGFRRRSFRFCRLVAKRRSLTVHKQRASQGRPPDHARQRRRRCAPNDTTSGRRSGGSRRSGSRRSGSRRSNCRRSLCSPCAGERGICLPLVRHRGKSGKNDARRRYVRAGAHRARSVETQPAIGQFSTCDVAPPAASISRRRAETALTSSRAMMAARSAPNRSVIPACRIEGAASRRAPRFPARRRKRERGDRRR